MIPPAFDGNFTQLVRAMDGAARALDALPDDQEFTQDSLLNLDDVRHAALRLADMVDAVFDTFEGRAKKGGA